MYPDNLALKNDHNPTSILSYKDPDMEITQNLIAFGLIDSVIMIFVIVFFL
jgi:hypothetical protein